MTTIVMIRMEIEMRRICLVDRRMWALRTGTTDEDAEVQTERDVAREVEREESGRDIEAVREQLIVGRGESSGLGDVA